MSAFDRYVDRLVRGESPPAEFPKNESTWDELFLFGQRRVDDIVELKRHVAKLEEAIEVYRNLESKRKYLVSEFVKEEQDNARIAKKILDGLE